MVSPEEKDQYCGFKSHHPPDSPVLDHRTSNHVTLYDESNFTDMIPLRTLKEIDCYHRLSELLVGFIKSRDSFLVFTVWGNVEEHRQQHGWPEAKGREHEPRSVAVP